MDDAPRRTLRALVARHGTGLCSDARRCEALLRDLAGAHRREVNILVSALKERVPLDLLAGQSAMPRGLLVARLAKRLEEHLGLTGEAARWAVESWALALGVMTEEEIAERERKAREEERDKRAAESPPPPPTETARPAPTTTTPPPRQQTQTAPPPPRTTTAAPMTRPSPPSPPPVVARPAGGPQAPRAPAAKTGGALPSPAQAPARDVRPRRRRRSLRGCAVGCLLLVLLAFAVFVGGPFVISLLREEQQRMNQEPPPVVAP